MMQTFQEYSQPAAANVEEEKLPDMMDKIKKLGKRKITPNMIEKFDKEMEEQK